MTVIKIMCDLKAKPLNKTGLHILYNSQYCYPKFAQQKWKRNTGRMKQIYPKSGEL